ncbi:MAG: alpha/beta hydrolase [Roseitalea sp.]|nr:alpha/beta hydrolase [Roseitalea sp.]MBO6951951.1 alpha/beta hydrolase [Rhizobiaceae bacterium]MBO6592203.1 alpha/beta hydrolase [Roseitalea sp.]MBO6598458.1 alpha/beta hydrolase [Roseitalea sp.]MBO6610904.1 alpha/beta hydrolase [Roseitalea sp.]
MKDWDDAFANMAHVPGSGELPGRWAADAAAYRAGGVKVEADIAYGDAPRERLDIVWPDETPKGLAVFVHGGYWMRLSKSDWTHYAEGARARGWAVALPSYTLTPEARIAAITAQIGRALAVAADRVAGPIRLSGHSAGGHLVTRMICDDTPLPPDVLARIDHTLSISGLHDLRPLMHTAMNDTLQLDAAEAAAESAVLHLPAGEPRVTAWVGGGERPEFIRQARILATVWEGLDAQTACLVDGDHNHFTVIEGLRAPDSAITRMFIG